MTAARLADLAARYWDFQCEESPIIAIQAGAPTRDDDLLRETPADHERRAAWARDALKVLAAIDPQSLDLQDRATHALLDRELTALIDVVRLRIHMRPALYPLGPEFTLIYWANSTALASAEDARRYLRRLARIPAALAGVRESLAAGADAGLRYTRLVLERAAGQVRGQISETPETNVFYGPLARAA